MNMRKKKTCAAIILALLGTFLCACQAGETPSLDPVASGTVLSSQEDTSEPSSLDPIIPEAPHTSPLRFTSYDEMYKTLGSRETCEKYLSDSRYNACFLALLKGANSKDGYLVEPYYKEERANLKREDGSLIVLFTQEKFNLPWTWYYCDLDGNDVVIEVCCLDVIDDAVEGVEIKKDASYADISEKLAPLYDTARNFTDERREVLRSVVERDLTLADGTQTTATVYDYNEENYWHRKTYRFRYGNLLVCVWNYSDDGYDFINDNLVCSLSFAKLES